MRMGWPAGKLIVAVASPLLLVAEAPSRAQSDGRAIAMTPIDFSIVYDGKPLGTPSLRLPFGSPAFVALDRAGYALRVTLTPKSLNGRAMGEVATELYVAQSGQWSKVATPRVMLPYGGQGSVEVARAGGGAPLVRMNVRLGTPAGPTP